MSILRGSKTLVETFKQFREFLDASWVEIAQTFPEEKQEELLSDAEELHEEDGDAVDLRDVPPEWIEDIARERGLNRTVIDVLDERRQNYVHLYDGTIHTIVEIYDYDT